MKEHFMKLIKNSKVLKTLALPFFSIKNHFLIKKAKRFDQLISNIEEGEVLVNLKNIPGKYQIDIKSHILRRILVDKEYEPEIVNLIKERTHTNKDAINIGANIGLYTCLLAGIVNNNQKVLAIEPTPNAYKHLTNNIKKNNYIDKVHTYKGIASQQPGSYELSLIQGMEEYSSIGNVVHPSVEKKQQVKISVIGETIDNLVEKYDLTPGILVIDVEGAEYQVLLGAIKTLQKYKPVIISEIEDELLKKLNNSSKDIVQLLKKQGYTIESTNKAPIVYPFSGNIIAY